MNMAIKYDEAQVRKMMYLLKISEEEAKQLIADDKAIDQGKKMDFDLPPDKLKVAREYTKCGTRKAPTVYNFDTSERKRKENPTKASIIADLAKFLQEASENDCKEVNITNKERQIAFAIGDTRYELTLVQKRAPK